MKPEGKDNNEILSTHDQTIPQEPSINGCLIYTRVSTSRQAEEGYSLNQQEASCRKLARQKEFQVLKIYREEGASGTTMARPQFQEMLNQCSNDKRVKAVIVIHTDRLARNTLEHLTIRTLFKKYKVDLISVLQPMLDDSPEGSLMDVVLAGVNEFYSKDLGRKISKGMLQKVIEGGWPSLPPPGYRKVIDPKNPQKTIVEPDPEMSFYIIQAFQRFKTGAYSVQRLVDELYQEGFRTKAGKRPAKTVIFRILRNIFYTGKMDYNGKIYQGKHKPLIDMETFTEVQKIINLHNKGADRTRKHNFLFNGLLFCGICGSQLTGEKHIKKSGLVFKYYRCLGTKAKDKKCRLSFIPMDQIEKQIGLWLKGISPSDKYTKGLKTALEIIAKGQGKLDQNKVKGLENRKQAIEKKMDRLEDYLLEGVMEEDRMTLKYNQLKEELKDITMELQQAKSPEKKLTTEDIDKIVGFVKSLNNIYGRLGKIEKKQLLKAIASKIWVKDKRITKVGYTQTFQGIIDQDLVRIRTEMWSLRDLIRTIESLYSRDQNFKDFDPDVSSIGEA